MQKIILEVDGVKDKLATVYTKQEYIGKAIDELAHNLKEHMKDEESNMKEFTKAIAQSFKDLAIEMKNEYATKIEHNQNKTDIEEIRTLLKWALGGIIVFVFGAVGTAIMNLIIK